MPKKLYGINRPDTRLRKNVFDLSASNTFSLSAGMLIPTMVRELNPGEKVELSIASMTRTQPLNTAAFVRMTQYFHAFFVPFKQLWSPWDNFINGVDYRQSTLQKKAGESIPSFSFTFLLTTLFEAGMLAGKEAVKGRFSAENSADHLGYSYVYGISRLLDMLGYGIELTFKPRDYVSNWSGDGKHNTFYREYGPGYLPPRVYDQDGRSTTTPRSPRRARSVDSADSSTTFTTSSGSSVATSPDGYIHPPVHSSDEASTTPRADVEYKKGEPYIRIASFADFCDFVFENSVHFLGVEHVTYDSKPSVQQALKDLIFDCFGGYRFNPFRLLAYQKIYYDFYRRQDYEASHPEHYNIDDQIGDLLDISDAKRLLGIFSLRYRWLAKDYFTGVVPSELYGTENLSSQKSLSQLLPESHKAMTGEDGTNGRHGIGMLFDDSRSVSTESTVSTRSIRAMFAIEKLLRLTRRAGDYDYISQTAAHYGVDVPKGRGDEVSFLGGWSSSIDISEVVTTALTEKGDPAQIYGRGIGSQKGKDVRYEAKEHGLLMIITSIVPDSDYSAVGVNNFNAKLYRGDYFHPEFQDLGLQPIMSHELAFQPHKLKRAKSDLYGSSTLLGYAPRYAEYKTAYDELHGEFRTGKEFSPWVSSIKVLDQSFFGAGGIKSSALFVSPSQLDSLFSVRFDGRESTDQFMCVAQNVCKVIRPMSVTGQNL